MQKKPHKHPSIIYFLNAEESFLISSAFFDRYLMMVPSYIVVYHNLLVSDTKKVKHIILNNGKSKHYQLLCLMEQN